MKTIALTMIVKNEGHIITRCLDSVKPLIDYVLIIDTGSTDGTVNLIYDWLRANSIEGVVLCEPWVNFAVNRSSYLKHLRETHPEIDYALAIDADEVLNFEVDPKSLKLDLDKNWYTFKCRLGSLEYERVSLLKNSLQFSYKGALHEYVHCDGIAPGTGSLLKGVYNTPIQDSARNKDPKKYERDAELLENAIASAESDPLLLSRYMFYLGQSYMDSNQLEKAIIAYEKRAMMGGWGQEIYWSLYKAAWMKERLGYPDDVVIQSYMRAHEVSPDRIEALHNAARFCRTKSKFNQAYLISKHARSLSMSSSGLFLERWMLEYGIDDEFSIACYYTGRAAEGLPVCESLLSRMPAIHRERLEKNIHFFREKLGFSAEKSEAI